MDKELEQAIIDAGLNAQHIVKNKHLYQQEVVSLAADHLRINSESTKLLLQAEELASAIVGSMNVSKSIQFDCDDEPQFPQRKEWCDWVVEMASNFREQLKQQAKE